MMQNKLRIDVNAVSLHNTDIKKVLKLEAMAMQ